jgi:aspartyl-tRNA(Asn)/glutamyl-tRNA(Gln) amidotransferase subunit C
MDQITPDITRHIAKLSGLRLTDAQTAAMTQDLGAIVGYMAVLDTLDTTGVEPRPSILPRVNHWRPDVCAPSADRAALLANAPAQKDGCVLVPKTFEEGGKA